MTIVQVPIHAPIRHLPKLGITSLTCWMIRDAPKPPLNAYARRSASHPTTSMQCSIKRCCYSEKVHMPKPQTIGANI